MQQGGEGGVLQGAVGDRQREHRGEGGADALHCEAQFENWLFGVFGMRGKSDCPSVPFIGQDLFDKVLGRVSPVRYPI